MKNLVINVTDVDAGLANHGIDMNASDGFDKLDAYVRGLFPNNLGWSYNYATEASLSALQIKIDPFPADLYSLGTVDGWVQDA